jgi:hypothetical protein
MFATFYVFVVYFSLCSLLLWQKSMLIYEYTNISIIMIIIIMVIHFVILIYVNRMLLDYIFSKGQPKIQPPCNIYLYFLCMSILGGWVPD